jgi:hypothetical protein
MAELLPCPRSQFFDDNGDPLVGGKLYSFKAGSSIPLTTYADKSGSIPNANPVVLNSRGEALIFLSAQAYKLILKDANDATIWTHDSFVIANADTETLAGAIADAQDAQSLAETAAAQSAVSATNAQASATDAANAKNTAETAAADASASASVASTKATDAQGYSAQALDYAEQALGYAGQALDYATQSLTYAGQSSSSASGAATSATNAASSATAAQTSATAASASASTASNAVSEHASSTISVHGIADTSKLLTDDNTKTLTNKTHADPLISDALRFSELSSTPANPEWGFKKLYAKTDGKVYTLNSGGLEKEVGSGASGGGVKNYLTNPKADDGTTTGWRAYDDTAGFASAPETGAGITGAMSLQFSVTADSPLEGLNSFQLISPIGNTSGEGISTDFTIDREDLGKVLSISFSYEFLSLGEYADGRLACYIIADPTGTPTVIQPVGFSIPKGVVGTTYKQTATFQALTSTASYRLCIHSTGGTSNPYTMKFDSFSVGPQTTVNASLITDWASYTPSIYLATTDDSANWTTRSGKYQRIGDTLYFKIFATGRAASSGTNLLSFGLPSVGTPVSNGDSVYIVGTCVRYSHSTGLFDSAGTAQIIDGLSSRVILIKPGANTRYTSGDLTGTTTEFSVMGSVKIQGWGSSTVSSDSAGDGRVVAFKSVATSGNIANGGTDQLITLGATAAIDELGGWNGTTTYTVKVPGVYHLTEMLNLNQAVTGNISIKYKINGGTSVEIGMFISPGQYVRLSGSDIVKLKAGDTVQMYVSNSSSTNPATINTAQLTLTRISGNSTIVAGESISAIGSNESAPSIPNSTATKLALPVIEKNTHGSLSTTGDFTVAIPGEYEATCSFYYGNTAAASTDNQVRLYKNGVVGKSANFPKSGTSLMPIAGIATLRAQCIAGDVLSIYLYQSTGGSLPLIANGYYNWVSFRRVGN